MQCKSCGFLVPQNLKFAIMKNFCPQCGEKLFSEKEMNHLASLKTRLSSQEFSKKLEEPQIYDIALFIYNEISSGYGKLLIDEYIKEILKNKKIKSATSEGPTSEKNEEVIETSEEELDEENFNLDEELDKVKNRIREEEAARVVLEHEAGNRRERFQDEDQDAKVHRLRELHRNSAIKPRNPMVRRIDS